MTEAELYAIERRAFHVNVHRCNASANSIAEVTVDATALIAEVRQQRETNTRLNRRCQMYEAGIAEKVELSDGSLGRALANAAAEKAQAEVQRLRAVVIAALCPCCDGSGTYLDCGMPTQCQWCDHRRAALTEPPHEQAGG